MDNDQMLETERFMIRPFTPDDWSDLQALAVDKETGKRDPHDPPWPTSEEECKGFANYLAERHEQYFAVCLKANHTLIGLFSFNAVDENGRLDLGCQMHSGYQDNDQDREALSGIIGYAFSRSDILSIETRTNPDWSEQLAPFKALGFSQIENDPGNWGIEKINWNQKKGE